MPDYIDVPFVSGNAAYDIYQASSQLGSLNGALLRTGTTTAYDGIMRKGFYRNGGTILSVIVCNDSSLFGNNFNETTTQFLNSTYTTIQSTLRTLSTVTPHNSDWYFSPITYVAQDLVTDIMIFDDITECLDALTLVNPSVHVSFNPVYIPHNPAVHVHFAPVLLDPNAQGGTSTTGGGDGTFDDTSDEIPIPELPTISAAESGLITLFKPSLAQLQSLGNYLWTNIRDFIENINKLLMNPMDYLIALNIMPVNPSVGAERTIKIGSFTTTINMPPVLSQWYEYDCGTVTLPKYWGSALDFAPNTKVSLFLPFIGSVHLNTDEVMGNRIGVKYRFDLLSGQCVAMVTIGLAGQTSVWYQFTGEAGVSVPLTGADWSRVYSAAIGAVGTAITGGIAAAASGAAAGGATAALAGATAADAASNAGMAYSLINDTSKGVRGVAAMREQMLQASQMALDAGRQAASAPSRVAKGVQASRIANTINNTVGTVMSGKVSIQHSGSISGSAGILGVRTPYLTVEFPNQSLAQDYKHFVGYPSNIYARLGTLSGYTECEQVIPNSLTGQTDSEVAQLLESLKGGVYLNFNNATTRGTGITTRGTGITLYNYTTSPNTVGKGATIVESYTGTFRDSVSITEPVFTIERTSPTGFNYVYIEAFNRFYYVTGVSADLHGMITVSCTVDPLETNITAIAQMNAIIRRQENQYNLYLDDGIFKAYQNTKHKLIAFPNSFSDYSYILALAGNGSN